MDREVIAKAAEIIAKSLGEHSHCALALIDADGGNNQAKKVERFASDSFIMTCVRR
ncbi:MAG: hypothetical protein LBD16_05740 [Oscillospiraceae bacterium]|nr:hypothetical protein [Oscillospiraceae bacterium]